MNTLYVGIDVSSKTNVIYLMKPDGSKHSNFKVVCIWRQSRLLLTGKRLSDTVQQADTCLESKAG